MKKTGVSMIALAISMGMTISSAFATDIWRAPEEDKVQPVEGRGVDWSGPAIGVFAGYGMSNHEIGLVDTVTIDGLGDEGFLGGAFVEYNMYMTERLLFGVGVSAELSSQKFEISGFGGSVTYEKDWGADLYAQFAVPVFAEAALVGVKGGWSFANLEFNGLGFSEDFDYDGPYGALFTRAELGSNWSANLEGSYHWYGEEDFGTDFVTDDMSELKVKLGVVKTIN